MAGQEQSSRKLGGKLLASVSRSFYLSIKILPEGVREPIGLAYLLARTSDTIADTASAPCATRLKHLQVLSKMIRVGVDPKEIELLQKEIVPADPAERELLTKLGPCLEWLGAQDEADRTDIVNVLEKIICGQEFDIVRFPDPAHARALQNAGELDEYTYLVAGCVGEFWTRICCRHLKGFARIGEEPLRALGVDFGKGLQLVNILRDMPADFRAGRCYLPGGELKAAGVEPGALRESAEQVRPVFDHWLKQAATHLDSAFRYIEALSNRRVRIACILPWAIGVRTLTLMSRKFPLTAPERVKVSRGEVKRLMLVAPLAALSNTVLRRLRNSLKRGLAS